MRIFIDGTTVQPNMSGTGVYTKNLIASLTSLQEVSQTLVLGNSEHLDTHPSLKVISYDKNPHIAYNKKLIGNRLRIQASASIFPNYFFPFQWDIPAAVTIHDVSFLSHPQFYSTRMRMWYRKRIQHTVRHAKVILTVSEASAQQIHHHLGVPKDRILVHPPAQVTLVPSVPPQHRQKTLVYLGNMEPKKNLLHLIEAYRLSGLSGEYRLVLAGKLHGSGSWAAQFRRAVRETTGVEWLGYVDHHTSRTLLAHASGFVNLSYVEGFGLSQLEAMGFGTPCLISNDPAQMEVATGHSLTVDPSDTVAVAHKLEDLVAEGVDRGYAAREHVGRSYSPAVYKRGVETIIDRLKTTATPVFPGIARSRSHVRDEHAKQVAGVISTVDYASVFRKGISVSKMQRAFPYEDAQPEVLRSVCRGLATTHPSIFAFNNDVFEHRQTHNQTMKARTQDTPEESAAMFRRRHRVLLRLLASVPFIRAVYYSGGAVHHNDVFGKPDLDLCVVTRRNCVWIGFIWVRLLALITGKKGSCCSNYLLDEDSQEIFWQRDYYTAFQLLFLKQVFRKEGTRHIRSFNSWINDYFPNSKVKCNELEPQKALSGWMSPEGGLFIINLIIKAVCVRKWTKAGLRNRVGGMLWDAFRIKLHTHDHRPAVYREYARITLQTRREMEGDPALKTKHA